MTTSQTQSTAARRVSTRRSGHLSYRKPQSGILLERRLQRQEEERLAAEEEKRENENSVI